MPFGLSKYTVWIHVTIFFIAYEDKTDILTCAVVTHFGKQYYNFLSVTVSYLLLFAFVM